MNKGDKVILRDTKEVVEILGTGVDRSTGYNDSLGSYTHSYSARYLILKSDNPDRVNLKEVKYWKNTEKSPFDSYEEPKEYFEVIVQTRDGHKYHHNGVTEVYYEHIWLTVEGDDVDSKYHVDDVRCVTVPRNKWMEKF